MQKALALCNALCIMVCMRNHTSIVRDAGAQRIATLTDVSIHTARSWAQRDSIPPEHWAKLIAGNVATADELIAAAAKRAA